MHGKGWMSSRWEADHPGSFPEPVPWNGDDDRPLSSASGRGPGASVSRPLIAALRMYRATYGDAAARTLVEAAWKDVR